MIIVTGHLGLAPGEREQYLAGCADVVRQARAAPGCRDFALSADLLDPDRINVLEVWDSATQLAAFRGAGIGEEQASALREVSVQEYDAAPR